jgi:predicted ester cyclase
MVDALIEHWVAMFNTGDTSEANEIAASAFIEHAVAPFGADEPGPVDGPRHLASAVDWLRAQFPDLHMRVEAVVREGDLVAVLMTSTGTNLGALNGLIPPTGRSFQARQTHWFRVRDGRLAEHWATRDDLATMLHLGVVTQAGGGAR